MIGQGSDKNDLVLNHNHNHNHRPTGHQMSRQGLYVPKKAYFGPKILIFTGGSKSFGTHVTEKPPWHLVQCSLLAWDQMGQRCQCLALNDHKYIIWAKSGCFWAKIPSCNGRKPAHFARGLDKLVPKQRHLFFARKMKP